MSIKQWVEGATKRMSEGNTFGALHDICSAVEATARNENYPPGKAGYKQWVHEGTTVILLMATHGMLTVKDGFSIAYTHPAGGGKSFMTLEEVVYHVFRCGMYHGEGLPIDFEFTEREFAGAEPGGVMKLPKLLVAGIIAAVVSAPSNAQIEWPAGMGITIGKTLLPFHVYGGKREWLVAAIRIATQLA